MRGRFIAFEGLDQSGKQTQSELLASALEERGHTIRRLSFPEYETAIGSELERALAGERDYRPDVMQLLYVANRYERKPDIEQWLGDGTIVVSDRYTASSIAYGEAFGLDATWLADIQRGLPPADLTILLDIVPETAVTRKRADRDRYERDLALQARVRASYHRQAGAGGWLQLNGERDRHAVAADALTAVVSRLGLR